MNEEPATSEEELEPEAHVPVIQQLALLAVVLLLIFGTGYLPRLLKSSETEAPSAATINPDTPSNNLKNVEQEKINNELLADTRVRAEAAFVWDVEKQRVLYEKNPDERLPIASITKLMTALVASELIGKNANVPVTLSAIQQDGSSGLINGESFSLQSLTDLTLLASSNDGAFAMAAAAGAALAKNGDASTFVEAMNIRADELGLTQTNFRNPTGLDISETEAGAYGSARDIAFLMEYIIEHQPTLLERTKLPVASLYNQNGAYHTAENTNDAVDQIAGLIGSKTGYTELAGGNLTIAFDAAPNRPVIVVVLGSTLSERFNDVVNLSQAARGSID